MRWLLKWFTRCFFWLCQWHSLRVMLPLYGFVRIFSNKVQVHQFILVHYLVSFNWIFTFRTHVCAWALEGSQMWKSIPLRALCSYSTLWNPIIYNRNPAIQMTMRGNVLQSSEWHENASALFQFVEYFLDWSEWKRINSLVTIPCSMSILACSLLDTMRIMSYPLWTWFRVWDSVKSNWSEYKANGSDGRNWHVSISRGHSPLVVFFHEDRWLKLKSFQPMSFVIISYEFRMKEHRAHTGTVLPIYYLM